MSGETLRLLILSDLHAYTSAIQDDDRTNKPSYLDLMKLASEPHLDPFESFTAVAKKPELSVDYVICPGDMGDRGSPEGIQFVWGKLQALSHALGAKNVLATAGNHDVDSRYKYNDHDHQKTLKGLLPKFPGLNDALCDQFWSRHFAVLDNNDWRMIVLNSCAFHGAGRAQKDEFIKGRVDANTIGALRGQLIDQGTRLLNILICHHHPVRNNDIEDADYSEMFGGEVLLYELAELDLGPWIIIHGHKHSPRVVYGQGPSSASIVFSAGSFGARLYSELASKVRNQIYLLEFPIGDFARLGLDIAARGHSWDWIYGRGWSKSTPASGLPSEFGFGRRISFNSDAKLIENYIRSNAQPYLDRAELFSQLPWLQFVLPADLKKLFDRLAQNGIKATFDSDGLIDQIGVRNK